MCVGDLQWSRALCVGIEREEGNANRCHEDFENGMLRHVFFSADCMVRMVLGGPGGNRFQSLSVGVNGRPRSPLKSARSRLSLELDLRRMTPGATSLLVSRRALRPRSQSS